MSTLVPGRGSHAASTSNICASCRRQAQQPPSHALIPGPRQFRSTFSTATSPSANPQSAKVPSKKQAPPRTHYDLFPKTLPSGPPPSGKFSIDTRALRREFLQLQAGAHPDKHLPSEKTRAEATSAYINSAYKTLQDPLLRAQYLLQLQDIDVAEDETLKIEDPELLMEVLEAREEIEEAEVEEDLDGMRERNQQRIAESEDVLADAFERGEVEAAKREAVRLRYWVNIQESLKNWEKGKPVVLNH